MIIYEARNDELCCEKREGFYCQPHLHKHLEIIYIETGSVKATVNDTTVTVEPGQTCVVFPNQIHSFENVGNCTGMILIAPTSHFMDFSVLLSSNRPVSPVVDCAHTKEILDKILEKKKSHMEYKNHILKGLLIQLLGESLSLMQLRPGESSSPSSIQGILSYCDSNYTDSDLSLGKVAEALGLSTYYISHIFSKVVKSSFSEYINYLRIQKAVQLLNQGDKSITEIAMAVGYNTIRSFNRQFLKIKGTAPSSYKSKGAV